MTAGTASTGRNVHLKLALTVKHAVELPTWQKASSSATRRLGKAL